MKVSLLLLIVFLIQNALAASPMRTTIEFKLMGEEFLKDDSKNIVLSSLNPALKKKGLPGFATVGVFSKSDQAYWLKLQKQVETSAKALNRDIRLDEGYGLYIHQTPTMCYRGSTNQVPKVIQALMGSVFHQDQGIQAFRFKDKKIIVDQYQFIEVSDAEKSKENRENYETNAPDDVKVWDDYDVSSDDVLVMSDLGPQGDGTELNATLIKRCE